MSNESLGLSGASTSSWRKSTSSKTLASIPTRSPSCAARTAITPEKGARKTESSKDLRATSAPAIAALWLATAPWKEANELSNAVFEIKPWSTKALLVSHWRCAISICDLAALACSCACSKRRWYSKGSIRANTCPAETESPSRTLISFTSPATRALMTA